MELRNKSRRSTGNYSSGYKMTSKRVLSGREKVLRERTRQLNEIAAEKERKRRDNLTAKERFAEDVAAGKRAVEIGKKRQEAHERNRKKLKQKYLEEAKRKREAENNRRKKQKIATFEKIKETLQTRLKKLKKRFPKRKRFPWLQNKIKKINDDISKLASSSFGFYRCGPGMTINPKYLRREGKAKMCVKSCDPGWYRDEVSNRCRKIGAKSRELSECKPGWYRDEMTNRCRKIGAKNRELKPCRPGWERNPITNRCIKSLDISNMDPFPSRRAPGPLMLSDVPKGMEINPDTGRLRKRCEYNEYRDPVTGRCKKQRGYFYDEYGRLVSHSGYRRPAEGVPIYDADVLGSSFGMLPIRNTKSFYMGAFGRKQHKKYSCGFGGCSACAMKGNSFGMKEVEVTLVNPTIPKVDKTRSKKKKVSLQDLQGIARANGVSYYKYRKDRKGFTKTPLKKSSLKRRLTKAGVTWSGRNKFSFGTCQACSMK